MRITDRPPPGERLNRLKPGSQPAGCMRETRGAGRSSWPTLNTMSRTETIPSRRVREAAPLFAALGDATRLGLLIVLAGAAPIRPRAWVAASPSPARPLPSIWRCWPRSAWSGAAAGDGSASGSSPLHASGMPTSSSSASRVSGTRPWIASGPSWRPEAASCMLDGWVRPELSGMMALGAAAVHRWVPSHRVRHSGLLPRTPLAEPGPIPRPVPRCSAPAT
jgi:hypothetical protein